MTRWRWAAIALLLPLFGAPSADYLSAKRKFDSIESEKLRPGSRVTLTPVELNAYVAEEAKQLAGQGVRDTHLQLGDGSATGSAMIDFVKLRQAEGKQPGWLLQKLLSGEKPVRVTARIQSGAGRAQVDVQSVEVSGITIDGKTLEFLIENFLMPQFPEAQVGKPFDLAHHVDRLEVKPDGVGVVLRR